MNNDKFVLLTGANGGIGKVTLEALIKEGYQVFSLDINDTNIENLDTYFIKCDVSKREDIETAFNLVKEKTNSLCAIISTIGIFKMESLVEGKEEDFKKMFDVNFFGIYLLNKIMFPLLSKGSRIINLTSEVARYSPQPFQAYYNLTKVTLDSYTDALRRECNYLGIKVIKVQSGSMSTPLLKDASNGFDEMVNESVHFEKPLKKFKYMMDRELKKTNDPRIISKLLVKILKKKNPRIRYRKKNSFALWFMGHLPEKWQDNIYKSVIK